VLLATYLVITLLVFLGAAFVVLSTHEGRTSEIQRKTTQAFYIAEAGIERAMYDLRQDFVNAADPDNPDWTDGDINGWSVDTADVDVEGFYPMPDMSDAANSAYPTTSLNGGSYTVRLKNESGSDEISIRSTGTLDSITQTIEAYVKVFSVSPWENAIFGGGGGAGGMVNGNVNISGSVHILGNDLDPGDNAIDLGGTAELVGNNYSNLESGLKDKVPALPTTVFNGETIETLNAELRVKNGKVGLSGSSTVGHTDVFGDSDKETVDGVYVVNGADSNFNGNKGTANVHSDNGFSAGYDLGDAVAFPDLDDPVDIYASTYDYFNTTGYTPTAGEMITLADLTPSTPDFQYGATSNCSVDANCIQMSSGKLSIKGKIYINGGTLGINGGEMQYTGSGTILVTGDVNINENLITEGDDSFPSNILGIMTPANINIGAGAGAANLDVMGLFYAENTITVAKQTDLVGTIVTDVFDITGQVPSIFQVPETANNLPDGMISGEPAYFMKIISWQKI